MHESNFNYNQTQQVAKERQRVELSSEGLYDIQALACRGAYRRDSTVYGNSVLLAVTIIWTDDQGCVSLYI